MVLPTNVDSSYADDGADASVKLHQQHHDTVHGAVNALAGGTTGQVLQKTGSADYEASWATPGYGGGDYFRSGAFSPGIYTTGTGSGALSLNRMHLRPFVVPVRRAFDRIGIRVVAAATAASGGVIRMGIYAPGNLPTTLIVDAGTISSESTGSKEITISQTLDPGVYWLATVLQAASCQVAKWGTIYTPFDADTTTVQSNFGQTRYQDSVSGALPSSFVPTNFFVSDVPAIMLRAA